LKSAIVLCAAALLDFYLLILSCDRSGGCEQLSDAQRRAVRVYGRLNSLAANEQASKKRWMRGDDRADNR